MIVTRTPLRVSFVGGGTDFPAFFEAEGGAVFSTAINQYVHVMVKRHSEIFDKPVRINYKASEEVDTIDEIENDIVRECLRFLNVGPPIYISTVGDAPASTGLGGSSAFTVGLLHALHAYRGERVSVGQLAEEACHIEIEVLGEPIGKQDQYAVAFGGSNVFSFRRDGAVAVESQKIYGSVGRELFDSMQLYWTGQVRDAAGILVEQQKNIDAERVSLRRMRDQVPELQSLLRADVFDVVAFGRLLDAAWELKRGLASRITNDVIDDLYARALAAGAAGGKLCGAGGGGFLLLAVPRERRASVREALTGVVEFPIRPEVHGSQVVNLFSE